MLSLSLPEAAYCCVVIIAAYAVRGSSGFGAAAAMPLLALVVPLKILVPVWTLLGAASSIAIVPNAVPTAPPSRPASGARIFGAPRAGAGGRIVVQSA